MDPDANLAEQEEIVKVLSQHDVIIERLWELRAALEQWRHNGGAEPDWSKAPLARKFWGK